MNTDAGTEDFFWRELNEKEEEEAKKEMKRLANERHNRFLQKLNEEYQKRQARR